MIGILVRRGCCYSRIFVITTQSGGKLYIGTSFCVVGFDDDHSGSDGSQETEAPIVYASLQEWHLDQVHDLLARVFWSGIDSTSSQTVRLSPSDREQ